MKTKIIIGSVLAILLMLSMPFISNINAESLEGVEEKEVEECKECDLLKNKQSDNLNSQTLLWFPGKCVVCTYLMIRYMVAMGRNDLAKMKQFEDPAASLDCWWIPY